MSPAIEESLRSEVRMLGALLGDALRAHEGEELFDLVEQVRARTKALRYPGSGDEVALEELLQGVDLATASRLVRAFASYFQLVNLAELEWTDRGAVDAPASPAFDSLLARCRDRGVPAAAVARLLERLEVVPVLTAHPTEAVRRSILDRQDRIGAELARLRAGGRPPAPDGLEDRIRVDVEILWHTDEVRSTGLRVMDEIQNAVFYLERVMVDAIPDVLGDLAAALARHYPEVPLPDLRGDSPLEVDAPGNPGRPHPDLRGDSPLEVDAPGNPGRPHPDLRGDSPLRWTPRETRVAHTPT
jgi:phosphoenolpyruvate carboxylase